MIGVKIEVFAARARNVPQRQQCLGRRQIFAGTPIDSSALRVSGDESLDQRRLAGAGFGGNGDNPAPARARVRKGVAQAPQLIFALQQLDGVPSPGERKTCRYCEPPGG
jgi:hypothetical protein